MRSIITNSFLSGVLLTHLISIGTLAQCLNQLNTFPFEHSGNSYLVVKENKTWAQAAQCAASLKGHLVHIETAAEQAAVYNAITSAGIPSNYNNVAMGGGISYIWIGATDQDTEGTWIWDGDGNNSGIAFWTGQGAAGAGGGSGTGYVNWGGSSVSAVKEPDDYMGQDAAAIALSGWPSGTTNYGVAGEWNDIASTNSLYYVIEFETLTGFKDSDTEASMNIAPNPCKENLQLESLSGIQNYSIFGLFGTEYLSGNLSGDQVAIVDVSHLPTGVYTIRILNNQNKHSNYKFIKE